jgi:hypothetical protein
MLLTKKKSKVYVVTSLPVDVKKDRDARMWKYSIMMSIRMVAIILMFFIPWPYSLLPILAAILLPWFAVVIANQVTAGNNPQVESPQKSLE